MSPSANPALALRRAALALGLAAAAAARADLAASSPFLPSSGAGAAAQAESGPIELRGIMSTPEGVAFCIYEVAKKHGTWVGLNESGHEFVVRTADPDREEVTVDYQGRPVKLALHAGKVAAAAPSGSGPPALGAAPAAGAAEEQRRLEAVAEEVRRRRAERQRAAQGAAGGVAPAPSR